MDERLRQLSQLYGIEPGYHDVWGNWRSPSEETLRALLTAMGVDVHDPHAVQTTLAALERERWLRVLPPITVLRVRDFGRGLRVQLQEASLGRALAWRITEESGETREERFTPLKLPLLEEHAAGDL